MPQTDQTTHAMPATLSLPFIKLSRSADTMDLIDNHPHAFLLLTKIAMLANRSASRITGLQPGQARITHMVLPGLTRQQFRTALHVLSHNHLITIQTTKREHTVTLCDSAIYDINLMCQQPTKQPSDNHSATIQQPLYSIKKKEVRRKTEKQIERASDPGGSRDNDRADQPGPSGQPVMASPTVAEPDRQTGPASPTSPHAFNIFWAIFPNKVGREIAVQEWNRLALTEPGYQDVVCKLRGHIDSRDYFSVTDSRFRKAPGPYLRDRRYDDIDDQTRPYRRTYEQVARWTVERGWLTAEQAGLAGAGKGEQAGLDVAGQAGQSGPAIANHRLQA